MLGVGIQQGVRHTAPQMEKSLHSRSRANTTTQKIIEIKSIIVDTKKKETEEKEKDGWEA